jgi:hypothetical protein
MGKTNMDSPRGVALQPCAQIRQQCRDKWWTLAGVRCMGCTKAGRSDPTKLSIGNAPGCRDGNLVNGQYDRGDR